MDNNRSDAFRARLRAGERLIGTFLKTPHPALVEVIGAAQLDCLCVDAEHAPFDRQDIDAAVIAGRAVDLPILVRVPSAEPHVLLNALDLGACGVVVPHVTTAQVAAAVAAACRYGPGGRGYAGSPRAAGYGTRTLTANIERGNATVSVIAQIEDAEAIEHIDEIAAVEGIDALFVGRMDLTVSLGARSADEARVVDAVTRICAAARRHGRAVGMFTPTPEEAQRWIDAGASLFLLASDQQWVLQGARELSAAFRR